MRLRRVTSTVLFTFILLAETVKVPQMAESISEGTLKTWLKQPGDSVEADEEVATIETDKVRLASAHFIPPFLRLAIRHAAFRSSFHRINYFHILRGGDALAFFSCHPPAPFITVSAVDD